MVPVPDADPEGDPVIVHVPLAGSPLKSIVPVATVHVGCVIVPITGAVGAPGTALIATELVAVEVQPAALVTVKV